MERVFGALSMDHPDIWWITKYRIHYKIKNSENENQITNNKKAIQDIQRGYYEISSIENVETKDNININDDDNTPINKLDNINDNGENRLNYDNITDSYNQENEEISRRIKMKRNEYKEDSRLLSKIQIQLCSSPIKNECNTYSVNDINRMNKLIEKKIQNILTNAKTYFQLQQNNNNNEGLSYNDNVKIFEYDFIKYLHDILIKNIKYGFSENGFTEYTIYGALIEHRCVCEGFSEAFMVLAQRAKIYTILATSNTHQWNMVFLEGKWYALDITWDIPNYDSIQHEYKNRKFSSRNGNNDYGNKP
ncbi:hypothetical protein PIROE2DRAFT_58693 [Piromyces sp. E2]|nr:hypothetical protein PIROE2DRAFT_58693 [Piromyces sp. E2]|eukprot:OUM67555.1 hypothetical protein PIROE2DRAFT_58693 [Piromyces sp. E2]